MKDAQNAPPDPGLTQNDLEFRMSEIERRFGRIEDRQAVPGDRLTELEAELGVMRQAVEDLSAGSLDLHNQLIILVSRCERVLGGAGEASLESHRRDSLRRSASAVGRVTRRAVRGTISAARRLVGPSEGGPDAALDVDVRLAASAVRQAPRIAVVVRVSDDPEKLEIPASLRSQTEPELTVVLWNEEVSKAALFQVGKDPEVIDAADRSAVAAALAADVVADMTLPLPHLHPTTLELCRWTAASEGLPLVVADAAVSPSRRGWTLEAIPDWSAAAAKGDAPARPRMAKMVGGRGWGGSEALNTPMVGAGFGRSYLPAVGTTGTVEHTVAPLEGVVGVFAAEDARPTMLVLTSGRGGEVAAWLLRSLGDDFRTIVILTDSDGSSSLLRGLTELADRVWPVGGFLEPVVYPSLVADVARAYKVQSILRIGVSLRLPSLDEPRPVVVDLPIDRSEVVDGADLTLALGGGIAEAARGRGVETVDVVPGPAPGGDIPETEHLAGVRSAYGVPEDARLVLTVCDLEPTNRPEVVTAIARRLRHREDVYLLLVGQGSLAGSISDLAGYFELDRFTFAPPGHSPAELVAVCDCVLSTAEVDPWPVSIGTALALGRSVVATEIDGVRELVADANGDRCSLRPPGDVNGLADAIVEALDTHRRPLMTKKAWNAAAARSTRAADAVREALGRGSVGESENH